MSILDYEYSIKQSIHSKHYYYLTMITTYGEYKEETLLTKPMTKNELLTLANKIHEFFPNIIKERS